MPVEAETLAPVIAPPVEAPDSAPGIGARLAFLLKVSRPGFWLVTAWFYLLPLGQQPVFSSWRFWLGLLYFSFPFSFLLYAWNDLADKGTDRFNPRKGNFLYGARGSDRQLSGLPLAIAVVQTPFVLLFTVLEGPRVLIWFAALLLANALYNAPRFGFRTVPVLDMLNQVGYLLVFPLCIWLNGVPALPWATYLFSALFAIHSHLFGQIMDLEPDRRSGRRTTATVIGILPAKALLVVLLLGEAALFAGPLRATVVAGLFVVAALWFTLDAAVLWKDRLYTTAQTHLFGLAFNLAALASMPGIWLSGIFVRHIP